MHLDVQLARTEDFAALALVAPAIVTGTEGTWMEQFFILKRYRRTGAGRALARHVLFSHPGLWEIGQMPGNVAATAFWRRVIGELTGEHFVERQVTEGWWHGLVQQFKIDGEASSQFDPGALSQPPPRCV